jgi:hypothetical protein
VSAPARGTSAVPGPAPELDFAVDGVDVEASAVTPTLVFRVRISGPGDAPIRSVALNVQLRIAAERRRYDAATHERLREVFGTPEQWAQSLGSLPWAHAAVNVPPFTGSTVVEIPVACTYDFEVVSAKYLSALPDGEIPVELLFNGSLFHAGQDGRLQVAHLSWESEASYRLPVATWRRAVDAAFPDCAWLRLQRDCFQRLQAYRSRHGWTTWEDTVDALLDGTE